MAGLMMWHFLVTTYRRSIEFDLPGQFQCSDSAGDHRAAGSATVYQSSNATFSVTATGSAPLAYNWRRGGTNLVDQGNVSGSTNSTLTLSNVLKTDATNYCVVVTNSAGSVTSSVVALTVLSTNLIQISSQPASVTVNPDQTAQFTVTANTSGPLFYQWFAGLAGGVYSPLTDGGRISGSATATLTISNEVVSDWGNYYVQISNADEVVVASRVGDPLPDELGTVWSGRCGQRGGDLARRQLDCLGQ